MEVKVKATGKVIIVKPYGDEYVQILPNGDYKVYTKQELDFLLDTTMSKYNKFYIARDLSGALYLYNYKPYRGATSWNIVSGYDFMELDPSSYPNITWDSEPFEVTLIGYES